MANPSDDLMLRQIDQMLTQAGIQLSRDRFNQIELPRFRDIELPTFRDVTLPTSRAGLTGFLPGDYSGGHAGLPSADFLTGATQTFGMTGNDPRWAAMGFGPNMPTMQMRGLYHDLENFTQTMDENRRRDVLGRQQTDLEMEMEYGGGPVLNGQLMPAWMAPHAEWAREFTRANRGTPPTMEDLRKTLAPFGRTPEDYAYAGNPQGTLGPGGPTAVGGGAAGAGGYGYGNTAMSPEQRRLLEEQRQFDADVALRTADLVNVRGAGDVFQSIGRARALEGTPVEGLYNQFQAGRGIPGVGGLDAFTMRRPGAAPGVVGGAPYGGLQEAGPGGMLAATPAAAPAGTRESAVLQRGPADTSPEDFLNPRANAVSAAMGIRLQRPDRIRAFDWERATPTERGVATSAYRDQGDLTPEDVEARISAGAPQFRRAARTRFF